MELLPLSIHPTRVKRELTRTTKRLLLLDYLLSSTTLSIELRSKLLTFREAQRDDHNNLVEIYLFQQLQAGQISSIELIKLRNESVII